MKRTCFSVDTPVLPHASLAAVIPLMLVSYVLVRECVATSSLSKSFPVTSSIVNISHLSQPCLMRDMKGAYSKAFTDSQFKSLEESQNTIIYNIVLISLSNIFPVYNY